MRQRMILLMVTAIGVSGLLSGCSAIGFVGGTIIDNTLTEERPLGKPTAEQLRDSAVTIRKGERVIVEQSNGQRSEGIYAGARTVTLHVDREDLSMVLESGAAVLVPGSSEDHDRSIREAAARQMSLASAGPHGADARMPAMGPESESHLVAVSADALLLLTEDGPVKIPLYDVVAISALRSKNTTMRLVILGAITDFMLLQGALGLLIASS